jgi:hypothetical protein
MSGPVETPSDPSGTPADAQDQPRRRGPRRAVRRGAERETVWGATTDDEADHGSNDDQLRRDVPPHW